MLIYIFQIIFILVHPGFEMLECLRLFKSLHSMYWHAKVFMIHYWVEKRKTDCQKACIIPLTLRSRSIFLWILKGGKVVTKLLTLIISGSQIMVWWERELLPSFYTSLLFEFFKMHMLLLWFKYVFNHFWLTTFCGLKFKLLSST